jgi:hypothetical protein
MVRGSGFGMHDFKSVVLFADLVVFAILPAAGIEFLEPF